MDDHHKVIKLENINKSYNGVSALVNVSFDVRKGEVHALVGENGAGKSTLMNILAGVTQKNSGKIFFENKEVEFKSPAEAIKHKVAFIHQELSMLPKLNVYENILMGRYPVKKGKINWTGLSSTCDRYLDMVGLDIDPMKKVEELSISECQLVEIARALSIDARIIIMDEPNSSLTKAETDCLFCVIERLKGEGISIIYVSHKMEEVARLSDRVTVLKDGSCVGTLDKDDIQIEKIIKMMVGRELERHYVENNHIGDKILEFKNVSTKVVRNISFSLNQGEILGFAGLVGSGRSEVFRALFGLESITEGEILYKGSKIEFKNPKEAINKGFSMIPEDRQRQSLFQNLSILINVNITSIGRMNSCFHIPKSKMVENLNKFRKLLRIKMVDCEDRVDCLSGGNQQKTIIARWLSTQPGILIMDEPTHGVDIGAKSEIYLLIRELTKQGLSIILISSELPEIISMSNRVVVMHEGGITGILERNECDEETIMAYATKSIIKNEGYCCEQ